MCTSSQIKGLGGRKTYILSLRWLLIGFVCYSYGGFFPVYNSFGFLSKRRRFSVTFCYKRCGEREAGRVFAFSAGL